MKPNNEIYKALDNILSLFSSKSMTLSEIAEIYSESLDKIIIQEEKLNNRYVGGELKIYYIDNNFFGTSYSLYFQNPKKEWIKKSSKSKPTENKYLIKEEYEELFKKKTVVFEIDPPKKQ